MIKLFKVELSEIDEWLGLELMFVEHARGAWCHTKHVAALERNVAAVLAAYEVNNDRDGVSNSLRVALEALRRG